MNDDTPMPIIDYLDRMLPNAPPTHIIAQADQFRRTTAEAGTIGGLRDLSTLTNPERELVATIFAYGMLLEIAGLSDSYNNVLRLVVMDTLETRRRERSK